MKRQWKEKVVWHRKKTHSLSLAKIFFSLSIKSWWNNDELITRWYNRRYPPVSSVYQIQHLTRSPGLFSQRPQFRIIVYSELSAYPVYPHQCGMPIHSSRDVNRAIGGDTLGSVLLVTENTHLSDESDVKSNPKQFVWWKNKITPPAPQPSQLSWPLQQIKWLQSPNAIPKKNKTTPSTGAIKLLTTISPDCSRVNSMLSILPLLPILALILMLSLNKALSEQPLRQLYQMMQVSMTPSINRLRWTFPLPTMKSIQRLHQMLTHHQPHPMLLLRSVNPM